MAMAPSASATRASPYTQNGRFDVTLQVSEVEAGLAPIK